MPLGIESFFNQTENDDEAPAPPAPPVVVAPGEEVKPRSRSMTMDDVGTEQGQVSPSSSSTFVQPEILANHHHHRQSLIYTIALYYCFIAVGLNSSIFNPTLVQLSHIFNTDLRTVSLIFPLRAIGCTAGTLINGFLNSYFNKSRQLILVCMLILKSLTTFLVPHWQSIHQFHANAFFQGFFTAANVVMVNVWLTEIWSKRQHQRQTTKFDIGNVLMQGLHFFFGCGTILGPLVAEPFLQEPFDDHPGFVHNNLVWPYFIAACLGISTATVFYILLLVSPYEQPETRSTKINNNQSTDEDLLLAMDNNQQTIKHGRLRIPVILSAALFLAAFACSEGTYLQFSASFCTKTGLHLSQPEAAMMASVLAISFTIFRGISVLVAMKLSPGTMIMLDLITIMAGNILVFLFANNNQWWLAIGYVLLGAGFSSVFPSLFPYLERKNYPVTDWIGSLITFSGGAAQVLAPFIIGLLIDQEPYVLVYFTFASVIGSGTMFSVMSILTRMDQKLNANQQTDNDNNDQS